MAIDFYKYHGTGNDFILLDGRVYQDLFSSDQIKFLCDRKYGIGADGIIIISPDSAGPINMLYYNSDGSQGMMCGNGARCAVHFAKMMGLIENECIIKCAGRKYSCELIRDNFVSVSFPPVSGFEKYPLGWKVDSGAAHYIEYRTINSKEDLIKFGRSTRYDPSFGPEGVNVNFIEECSPSRLKISTYEKGVEDLTLSCGTGAIAGAIIDSLNNNRFGKVEYRIDSTGGTLYISFEIKDNNYYDNIVLSGAVSQVYKGSLSID